MKTLQQLKTDIKRNIIPEFDHFTHFSNRNSLMVNKKIVDKQKHPYDIKEDVINIKSKYDTLLDQLRHRSIKDMGLDSHKIIHDSRDVPGFHTIQDGEDHIKELHNGLSNHYNKYNNDDKESIIKYTGYSQALNNYLKSDDRHDNPDKIYEDDAKKMHNVMHRHEPYEHGHYVWSGIGTKVSNDPIKPIKQHGVIKNKMYTSTSINPAVAKGFSSKDKHGNHNIARIYIPGNSQHQNGMPKSAYVSNQSILRDEREKIIEPDSHFIFHKTPTIIHDKENNKHYHVYHGMMVPKHIAELYNGAN